MTEFNAIMIDRKGFVKSFTVPLPPPRICYVERGPSAFGKRAFATRPPAAFPQEATYSRVEFKLCGQTEDTFEYREI